MKRVRFKLDMVADDERELCRQLADLTNTLSAEGLSRWCLSGRFAYLHEDVEDGETPNISAAALRSDR